MSISVVIASDHGAVARRREVVAHLQSRGIVCRDLGVAEGESSDYPDQALAVAEAVVDGVADFGVLLCGTGIGISIAANKVRGVRCALVNDAFTATMAKEHNNANVLALGGRIELHDPLEKILDAFVDTDFGGERHQRRIDKITALEAR